jgi:RimJ/RimL family protein N-acetyltransferase
VVVPPPYRIETARLVVRCWEPRDAPLLKAAIDSSLDHLRPWMPWAAAEPTSLDEKIELLRGFRGRFDSGEDFVYGIFSADDSDVLGGCGLHSRVGDDALEIGYWIRQDSTGKGLATEATAALTRAAFLAERERVEIHVDPANDASCRIPQRLGYVLEGRLRQRLAPSDEGASRQDVLIFSMLLAEFDASEAERLAAADAGFDAAGRKLM